MKSIRRLTIGIMCVLLLVGLAACGKKEIEEKPAVWEPTKFGEYFDEWCHKGDRTLETLVLEESGKWQLKDVSKSLLAEGEMKNNSKAGIDLYKEKEVVATVTLNSEDKLIVNTKKFGILGGIPEETDFLRKAVSKKKAAGKNKVSLYTKEGTVQNTNTLEISQYTDGSYLYKEQFEHKMATLINSCSATKKGENETDEEYLKRKALEFDKAANDEVTITKSDACSKKLKNPAYIIRFNAGEGKKATCWYLCGVLRDGYTFFYGYETNLDIMPGMDVAYNSTFETLRWKKQ